MKFIVINAVVGALLSVVYCSWHSLWSYLLALPAGVCLGLALGYSVILMAKRFS